MVPAEMLVTGESAGVAAVNGSALYDDGEVSNLKLPNGTKRSHLPYPRKLTKGRKLGA